MLRGKTVITDVNPKRCSSPYPPVSNAPEEEIVVCLVKSVSRTFQSWKQLSLLPLRFFPVHTSIPHPHFFLTTLSLVRAGFLLLHCSDYSDFLSVRPTHQYLLHLTNTKVICSFWASLPFCLSVSSSFSRQKQRGIIMTNLLSKHIFL